MRTPGQIEQATLELTRYDAIRLAVCEAVEDCIKLKSSRAIEFPEVAHEHFKKKGY